MNSISHDINFREVTSDNIRAICSLRVKDHQRNYVVESSIAIAEAKVSRNDWLRAIYCGEIPVGLLVLKIPGELKSYFLWRLMIDQEHQNSDYGRQAMKLLVNYVRSQPNNGMFLTSVVAGDYSPQKFYESLGFRVTGEQLYGEALMSLKL